jgi:predicted dehydrogenase
MAQAAEAAGVTTQVGFNYLCNPMLRLAREIVRGGEIGEVRSARLIHAEDYMADADAPGGFRLDPAGGGALADIGSHALATAEFLLGPITAIMGDCVTAIAEGPMGKADGGAWRSTTSLAPSCASTAARARASRPRGSPRAAPCSTTWRSTARRARSCSPRNASTSCTLPDGRPRGPPRLPPHRGRARPPPYGRFSPAPGHQIGFNDLKAIEMAGFLDAVAGRAPEPFGFRAGLRVQELVEAVQASARDGAWRAVP